MALTAVTLVKVDDFVFPGVSGNATKSCVQAGAQGVIGIDQFSLLVNGWVVKADLLEFLRHDSLKKCCTYA